MTIQPTQAGKRFILLPLFLACLFLACEPRFAMAKWESGALKEKKTEEVLSFDDLWESTIDLMPTVSPAEPPVSKAVQEKPASGVIEAKRLSDSGKAESKPAEKAPVSGVPTPPTPPYRVYPSPYIPDERPVAQPSQRPTMQDSTQDMPIIVSASEGAKEDKNAVLPVPSGAVTAPVSGMSRQFFPILPVNAASDATPQLLPLASNHSLAEPQAFVSRAIIIVHDLTRNANDALATVTTLAGSENNTTLILAPQFPLDIDVARFAAYLPDNGNAMARWPVMRNAGWQTGDESVVRPPQKGISSFTVMDLLLLYLADRQMFPGLQSVVVAGHGMGADFVQRYAAMGQAPDLLIKQGMPVRFLVANASSYLYFTSVRPAANAPNFVLADTAQCPGVTTYPYGLGKLVPYARRSGIDTIRLRFPERHVMYLFSENIMSDPYLDNDCAAVAQGKDRRARGRHYERYLTMSFGDATARTQTFTLVSNAGYDPVTLLGSYCGMAMLFGDGTCTASPVDR